ncbi:reverse transcriptase domain-containing protein [Tanacetum coccineum]
MAKEDEEKTAFITSQGIFCYTKMPFGLRNAGATYQRLVDKAFHKQIGRNLEVYVDDLVIKSRTEDEIVRDIEETFKTLREINMKLNPKKCTFGVENGMFLGYKANTKGLKVCPDKTVEAEEAFKQMKKLIAEIPMLTALIEKEELIVYLAAAKETVDTIQGGISRHTLMEVKKELPPNCGPYLSDGSPAQRVPGQDLISQTPSKDGVHLMPYRFRWQLVEEEGDTWMTPIFKYLTEEETLPGARCGNNA